MRPRPCTGTMIKGSVSRSPRKGWSFVASPAWENFLGHAAKTLLSPRGPSSVPFFRSSKSTVALKSRTTLRKLKGCWLIGMVGGSSEYIQHEGLLTILLTGSFACNQVLSVTGRVTFCALLLFTCNVLANFFRIGCVGLDAKGKGKGKGKKGGKGKGKGKDNGPQPKRAAAPNGGAA